MKRRSLLRSQLLLLGAATLVSLILGLVASIVMTQIDKTRFQSSPTLFLAHIMDQLRDDYHLTHEQVIAIIKNSNDAATYPVQAEGLTRDKAQALLNPGTTLPEKPYEVVEYGPQDAWHFPARLIRLASDGDEQFLSVIYRPRLTPMHRIFNMQTYTMMFCVFLAGFFSVLYMFYFMRKQARFAANIISQLRDGDLSARFPVGKLDEIGLLMLEFNRMADEIQTLVETIRHSELGRMRRLQELAHDLRTPVASLKNLLETLQNHCGEMPVHSQQEMLGLSMKEVDYFQRLVEDLLFLAQVRDPKYAVVKTSVTLDVLLSDELDSLRARYPNIKVVEEGHGVPPVRGDGHLLRRLFRNALENAFSFAKSRVVVKLERRDGFVFATITDDGRGFSDETLSNFGAKRGTRFVTANPEARLSVGLGSVIMKEVVTVHSGSLTARNNPNAGAEIEIALPENHRSVREESHPKLSLQR